MADWFKLHENWFHEPRLQWAIKEQASVVQVWLWALTECCRTKSDTIGLHSEDYEMIGIQQLLNLSPGLFNQGIGLLEKIKYIQVDQINKTIKVLKWKDFQSDYLMKKSRRESDSVGQDQTKSDSVRLEERRGDKNREEQKASEVPISSNEKEEVIEVWNSMKNLPQCRTITASRKKVLRTRLSESFFSQNWKAALEKLKASSFCLGGGSTGWKANVDWFLKPDSVPRLMEGFYDNKPVSDGSRPAPVFHRSSIERSGL